MKISDEILGILGECRIDGNVLYLPDRQLDRPTYQAVNKVLTNIGGKWNRKAKGHVFSGGDPEELLDNVILTGEVTDLKKQYQFFPTPRPVAQIMCAMAELDETSRVLEPSCGRGDLADVIYEAGSHDIEGVELNSDMANVLHSKPYPTHVGADFLQFATIPSNMGRWNRIIMNPPFTKQQDVSHILAAFSILEPGGVLISVVSESAFFRSNHISVAFREFLDAYGAEIVPVEEGSFKESGTMIRTRIIKIRKPVE